MAEAVDVAGAAALPGDVVLLSPGCASFDWYPDGGFEARGDHFRRLVRDHVGLRGEARECERASASAACVAERDHGAATNGLRGRGTQ